MLVVGLVVIVVNSVFAVEVGFDVGATFAADVNLSVFAPSD